MPEENPDSVVSKILRSAVQKAIASGGSPEAIRDALGLGDATNILHVQNNTLRVEINSPGGIAAFVQESGPTWVQYIDHRPHTEWEDVIEPVEFDPAIPVDIEIPGRQG
ncbi:hypothetical protein EDD29_4499 [Actinocorallia herbida]|uniref:Uncharacterized protein n=1 Tax=Actinocorallia herbida TaxID=58109 RepID=A0A3N1D062_9ACTN|nr:hypothetical protein [Actinocorallia herbida]ROO86915.1 hypothetical protein EDD29_4499 [Actinocorallia herbida]